MNRICGVVFFVLFVSAAGVVAEEVNWRHEPEGALREARETERTALLFFTAPWCGYCRMMDDLTFRDEGVVEALRDFVPIKVDHDTYPMWVARYGVRGIPATVAIDERGRPVARADGYLDADRFSRWLRNLDGQAEPVRTGDSLPELAGELRDGLRGEDPGARETALANALDVYLGEDRVAAGIAEQVLREAVRDAPEEFAGLLNDYRLAVRILATNLYRGKFGDDFDFDPWADSREREAMLRKLFGEELPADRPAEAGPDKEVTAEAAEER